MKINLLEYYPLIIIGIVGAVTGYFYSAFTPYPTLNALIWTFVFALGTIIISIILMGTVVIAIEALLYLYAVSQRRWYGERQ